MGSVYPATRARPGAVQRGGAAGRHHLLLPRPQDRGHSQPAGGAAGQGTLHLLYSAMTAVSSAGGGVLRSAAGLAAEGIVQLFVLLFTAP